MKIFTTPLCNLIAAFAMSLIWLSSCSPEPEDGLPPALTVMFADGSAICDTSIEAGQSIDIIIEGSGISNNITYFSLLRNGEHVLDSGLNAPAFISHRRIFRSTDSIEKYTIVVRDRNFMQTTVSFNIGLKPTLNYGSILSWEHLILGAQNNASIGGFLNIFNGQVYTLSEAFLMQDSVQLVYFYDAVDMNTIASPNANIDTSYFGGSSGLANWTVKNEIRCEQLFYSEQEFLDMQNDSLIIANLFPYETGKRKAKVLQAGNIYEFGFSGIYGIFYVNSVTGTDAGVIDISIKIQQP